MHKIVVLGGGIGGIPMCYELKDMFKKEAEITLISDLPYFEFTPSNPWVAVNWRKQGQIRVDLEPTLKKKGVQFIHMAAARVLPEDNRVELTDGRLIDYDYLVIATGPQLAFDEIEGLGPQGHTASICKTAHAQAAGDAWTEFLKDPGPVVVGAAQGASCFGPAYEYALILDTDLRKHGIRDRVPITFVTSEPYIGHLGLDGVGDTKGLLESKLRNAHIKWICNAKIDAVEPGVLRVTEHFQDGQSRTHDPIAFKHAMILPAFRGVDAVMGIEGLSNPRGFILTDAYQRNPTHKNIFSVGVCVAIPPMGQTPVPVGVPKTGYMIESMVTAAAHNIKALCEGREPNTKPSLNAICLADFGDGGVAFIAKPQIPPRNLNWAASGKWVHLAKVAFEKYFLRKIRKGKSDAFWEKFVLDMIGVKRLKSKK